MKHVLIIILVLAVCKFSIQSSVEDLHYVAGVVEFMPENIRVRWEQRLAIHIDFYTKFAQEASEKSVDILVFPEYGLNNADCAVEVTNIGSIPCDLNEAESLMKYLSCLARKAKLYLSINLTEKELCSASTPYCSQIGFTRYNTNIVFDRNGKIVAKYRKHHLFREGGVNASTEADLSTFDTDFGVTFGQFICFDLLFQKPAMQLVKNGIKNFIFPAFWTSELPFLSSTQIYQSWSFKNNVNLLTAGTNYLSSGGSGTGFFAGRSGDIFSMISDEPTRKLYIAKIPKVPSESNILNDFPDAVIPRYQSNFPLGRDFIEEFWTKPIDLSKNINETMCYKGGICCSIIADVTVQSEQSEFSYKYRLAIFQGERTYAGYEFQNVSICGIMACTNNNLESCGRLFEDQTRTVQSVMFKSVNISLELDGFIGTKEFLLMPSSQDFFLNPLKVSEFNFRENILGSSFLELLKPHSDLLSFGIYGHIYDKQSSSGNYMNHKHILICAMLLILKLKKYFS